MPKGAPSAEYLSLQLTEDVIANLTDLKLTDIELFGFDDEQQEASKRENEAKCKTYPGDAKYPGKITWKVFDILTGGALIKNKPLGSACYEGKDYDEKKCQFLLDNWNQSTTQ